MNEIQRVQPGELQQAQQQLPVAELIGRLIDSGKLTSESAAAVEKLCNVHLQIEALRAQKEYARAMAAMQAELPPIVKHTEVHDTGGKLMYRYAKYEEMMQAIQPCLTKHGFSIACDQRADERQLVAVLKISHVEGHSETHEFAVRHSQGTRAMSTAQVDASDSNLARRHALARALNLRIVGEEDDDARNIGEQISPEEAASLKARVQALGKDREAAFLKFAGAASYEEIGSAKLPELLAKLDKAEKKPPKPAQGAPPTAPAPVPDLSDWTKFCALIEDEASNRGVAIPWGKWTLKHGLKGKESTSTVAQRQELLAMVREA